MEGWVYKKNEGVVRDSQINLPQPFPGKPPRSLSYPLPETNSENLPPENGWLEDDPFPFGAFRPIFLG